MLDILIVNDNKYREQFSSELLSSYLKEKYSVKIVSKTIFRTSIKLLKPRTVIVPRVQTDFHDIFEYKEKYNFKIFFIPVEHSGGNQSGVLSFLKSFLKKDKNDINHSYQLKKNITKIFVPGKFYKDVLLKEDLFNEEQIIVTGSPNSDLWFKDINHVFKKEKVKETIGIATSFKSFMFGSEFKSIQHAIQVASTYPKNLTNKGNDLHHVNISAQEKDLNFLWFEMYQFLLINKIINDNKHIQFSIRAHPMENIQNVISFQKNLKNLHVDRNLIMNEWISNQKIILSFGSTLLYDSYFSGVPSISLRKLMPKKIVDLLDDYLKPVYLNFPIQPESFDELYQMIDLKNFDYQKYFSEENENKIKETSLPSFNFPRENKFYQVVGKEISSHLENKNTKLKDKIFYIFYDIIISLKQIKLSNFSFRYKYVNLDKLYNPLSFYENYKVKKYIKKIIKN